MPLGTGGERRRGFCPLLVVLEVVSIVDDASTLPLLAWAVRRCRREDRPEGVPCSEEFPSPQTSAPISAAADAGVAGTTSGLQAEGGAPLALGLLGVGGALRKSLDVIELREELRDRPPIAALVSV